MPARSAPPPHRAPSRFSIAAVLLIGAIATIGSLLDERAGAERRDQAASAQAIAALTNQVSGGLAALKGVDGIATDGEITDEEFTAFATDALRGAPFEAMLRERTVPEDERAAFEERTGLVIRDGVGPDAPRAAPRAVHVPVVQIVPLDQANRNVVGFDITSDPVRQDAADRAVVLDRPVVSKPLLLAATGRTGFFLVRAVRSPGREDEPPQYISSGIAAEDILAGARSVLPAFTRISIRVDDRVLAGEESVDGVRAELGGDTEGWSIDVDDPDDLRLPVPLAIVASTILLTLALLVLIRRQRDAMAFRDEISAREHEAARHNSLLAGVARRLSFAETVDDVIEVITQEAAGTVDAAYADVGLLVDADTIRMSNRRLPVPDHLRDAFETIPIDADVPVAEAVRTGTTVVVEDLATYRSEHPGLGELVATSQLATVVAAPIFDLDGGTIAVVIFLWTERARFHDTELSAVETVTRICGQALRRTQLSSRTAAIAQLTAALTASATEEDVRAEVGRWVPPCLGAASATIVRSHEPAGPRRRTEAHHSGVLALHDLRSSDGHLLATLEVRWERPIRFDSGINQAMDAISEVLGQTLERVALSQREERAARQAQLLAELGRTMAEASTVSDIIATLKRDAAAVVAADRLAVTIGNAAALRAGRSVDDDDADVAALLAGEPVVRTLVPSDGAAGGGATPRAEVSIAMCGPGRHLLGLLRFSWDTEAAADDAAIRVARQIADAGANAMSQAIAAERHRRQAASLNRLASELAAVSHRADVAGRVAAHMPTLVGSQFTIVAVVDADGEGLVAIDMGGLPPDITSRYRFTPLDARLPAADAFRTGSVVAFPSPERIIERYPGLAHDVERARIGALAILPLRSADHTVLGVMSVGWADPVDLDDELTTLLTTIAELAGQTLERTDLYELEHRIVSTMQQRLLNPIPVLDGLDIAAVYEPATSAVGIGGDWYEVFSLADGSAVVVVGDVTGHGVDAVVSMAQVQYIVAGLIRSGSPLSTVFSRANEMLTREQGIFSTAQILHLDRRKDRLGYVNAGHPWALLRDPGGDVRVLSAARQPLLGVVSSEVDLAYEPFPVGSVLLAYTDGLIERRDETITASIQTLARLLAGAEADRPAEEVLSGIRDGCRTGLAGQGAADDDVAAILVTRRA